MDFFLLSFAFFRELQESLFALGGFGFCLERYKPEAGFFIAIERSTS